MAKIETPLLVTGRGPAVLVAAKVASGHGLACLVAGHEPIEDLAPVELDARSLAVLEPHGVLGVLRPYATTQEPFAIAPLHFEHGLKHHCVADMLVTVYDGMWLRDGAGEGPLTGVLTDGRANWEIVADAHLDVGEPPADLNAAIDRAATDTERLVASLAGNGSD